MTVGRSVEKKNCWQEKSCFDSTVCWAIKLFSLERMFNTSENSLLLLRLPNHDSVRGVAKYQFDFLISNSSKEIVPRRLAMKYQALTKGVTSYDHTLQRQHVCWWIYNAISTDCVLDLSCWNLLWRKLLHICDIIYSTIHNSCLYLRKQTCFSAMMA